MKIIITSLALTVAFCTGGYAQKRTHQDSVEVIDAAHRYGATFNLNKKDFEKFKQHHFPVTSDYFTPSRGCPNVLIRDSLFVKTYRLVALAQTLARDTVTRFRGFLPDGPSPLDRNRQDYMDFRDPLNQIARKDAKRFILPDDLLKRLKAGQIAQTSDYFKPSVSYASAPVLVNDSTYSRMFREKAYELSLARKVGNSK